MATPSAVEIIQLERDSIRSFVESCAEYLTGRVLDFGAGKQPYREIVERAGGEYVPHDLTGYPASISDADYPLLNGDQGSFDALLNTQMTQYLRYDPILLFQGTFGRYLKPGGWLVMTGGTCWREIQTEDELRLTVSGVHRRLVDAGFDVVRCESRASIDFPGGFSFSLGYGVLAHV